jgi:hypothetical protein
MVICEANAWLKLPPAEIKLMNGRNSILLSARVSIEFAGLKDAPRFQRRLTKMHSAWF